MKPSDEEIQQAKSRLIAQIKAKGYVHVELDGPELWAVNEMCQSGQYRWRISSGSVSVEPRVR